MSCLTPPWAAGRQITRTCSGPRSAEGCPGNGREGESSDAALVCGAPDHAHLQWAKKSRRVPCNGREAAMCRSPRSALFFFLTHHSMTWQQPYDEPRAQQGCAAHGFGFLGRSEGAPLTALAALVCGAPDHAHLQWAKKSRRVPCNGREAARRVSAAGRDVSRRRRWPHPWRRRWPRP